MISDGAVPLYGWPELPGARIAVTSRVGGVSGGRFTSLNLGLHVGDTDDAVLINRERAAHAVGSPLDDCVFAEQVAGASITHVTSEDRGSGVRSRDTAIPATDALITTDPSVTLAVMAADCMLIALVDPEAGALAVVHAGWPGATNGIIGTAVAELVEVGADANRIHAAIGPAVAGDRYQVGGEVAEAAEAILGSDAPTALRPDGTGRHLFDIVAAAHIQLRRSGIAAARIHTSPWTTGPDTPFYSHRFEGPTGRFALLARLDEPDRGTTAEDHPRH